MKKHSTIKTTHGLAVAGVGAWLAAMSGHAQAADNFCDNFYVGVESGVALAQNTSILDNTGFGGSSTTIKFQTGWRAGGYVGYNFCEYFSAQLDSGMIWNNLAAIGDQTLSSVGSAHLEQVPLLVEGVCKYPLGDFKPYVTAGLGGDFGIFDSTGIPLSGPPPNPNYHSSDTTFAYEAGLGFTYSLTKHLDLGVVYKLVGSGDHNWNANGISLKTDGIIVHTIEATVSWRF